MFRLLRERPDDTWEVETLLDLAFAPGRTALSSYRLRQGVAPVSELCTVVRDEYNAVAGAIRYWPVQVGPARAPALLLGPVAVHPTRQGEGLGALLILETLVLAQVEGWTEVILIGDEPYYRRFGFTREAGSGLLFPAPTNPERVLARSISALPAAERQTSKPYLQGEVMRWAGPPYELVSD